MQKVLKETKMAEINIPAKGYLKEEFRLFHNKDTLGTPVGLHFHDFHKLTMVKEGVGSYLTDGRLYDIRPGDIIMIPANTPHKPEFEKGRLYDRYTFYISTDMMEEPDIFTSEKGGVFRFAREHTDRLFDMAFQIEREESSGEYGAYLAAKIKVLGLLIQIGRYRTKSEKEVRPVKSRDDKMLKILRYINDHISEPLTIGMISGQFYISRYHMMRLFKASYGCSIHEYISERRLIAARELIEQGISPAEACYQSGYGSYSAFSRAYRTRFDTSPGRSAKAGAEKERIPDYYPE